MKKLFKFAALLLGSSSCLANCPKTLSDNALCDVAFTDRADESTPEETTAVNALDFLQDLNKIHYL